MSDPASVMRKFYSACQVRDYKTMQECYHPDATFSDPVFTNLNATEVKAMWQMLLTSSKDLVIEFSKINTYNDRATCRWQAWYTFTLTGKKVHNIIDAEFIIKGGQIIQHRDKFDFWRWNRMALGITGIFLGWSPLVKNKVRAMAHRRLQKYMLDANKLS